MDDFFIDCTVFGTGIVTAVLPEIFMAMDRQEKGKITSWLKTKDDLFLFWDMEKEDGAVPLIESMDLTETIRIARNWISQKVLIKKGMTRLQADAKQIHISIHQEREAK